MVENQLVICYDWDDFSEVREAEPKTYSFDEKVPANIWNGDCEVDFKYIYSQMEFMYDRKE